MSEIWPQTVFQSQQAVPEDTFRPFHCVLLMPFGGPRFDMLAQSLESVVRQHVNRYLPGAQRGDAVVERLDWVTSAVRSSIRFGLELLMPI